MCKAVFYTCWIQTIRCNLIPVFSLSLLCSQYFEYLLKIWENSLCCVSCSVVSDSAIDPMDCSPPGSSVRGILQARILELGYHFLFQGIFPTQRLNPGLLHCRQSLYHLSHRGSYERIKEYLLNELIINYFKGTNLITKGWQRCERKR